MPLETLEDHADPMSVFPPHGIDLSDIFNRDRTLEEQGKADNEVAPLVAELWSWVRHSHGPQLSDPRKSLQLRMGDLPLPGPSSSPLGAVYQRAQRRDAEPPAQCHQKGD